MKAASYRLMSTVNRMVLRLAAPELPTLQRVGPYSPATASSKLLGQTVADSVPRAARRQGSHRGRVLVFGTGHSGGPPLGEVNLGEEIMEKQNLDGLRVAAFESRRAAELARLIEKQGGQAFVSPSMREVPLGTNTEAVEFANAVIGGEIDVVIFTTGVGFRHLLAALEGAVDRDAWIAALAKTTTIARGPKSVAAMKDSGLTPTYRAPQPNTWRDVLAVIDEQQIPVAGKTYGIQEYGQPNADLVAELEKRGATVRTVQVYRWELPTDCGPLEENVRAIAAGERDIALFTSAHQVVNMLRMAERLRLAEPLKAGLARMVVGSIGPTTSEMLREQGLPCDLEPDHPKMGPLVLAAAERAATILATKAASAGGPTATSSAAPKAAQAGTSGRTNPRHPSEDGLFMKACRREPTPVTPVWLMRQAGRYMPEYREIRAKTSFLDLCKNPSLCAEIMLHTVERLKVDAAIIFSDLLPILEPMGFDLEFTPGDGPAIHNPIRSAADVDRVRELESLESLEFVMETVRQTRAGLADDKAVIGFAGAPFTLASYAIEGSGSRNYIATKRLMYQDSGAWHALLGKLARSVASYLNGQIEAGAQCVQLFDSWAGCLHPDDYRRFVLPHVQAIIQALPQGTPVINFATGNPVLLPLLAQAGGDVIGVDWRIRLDDAWKAIGHDRAIQGNLDPTVLFAPLDEIRRRVQATLDQAEGRPGHIFNLGHGVLPETPVDHVVGLVEMVHELSQR